MSHVIRKRDVPCPVCDARACDVKYLPRIEIDDPKRLYGAASGIPGAQRLVTCRACGVLYETPRFPDEAVIEGYRAAADSYDSQHHMRVHSFHRALISLKGRIPPPGSRVLDVGTGGGAFLEAARRFGYSCVGLEPSRHLVEQARRRGLEIRHGTLDDLALEPESFDMVCLWDVLEHLTNPKRALLGIRGALRPDGVLLVNYPDIGTWLARAAGSRFWWILSVHLQHFTPRSIREICQRTGFEAFHFQRYWQTLEFGYLEDLAVHFKIPLSRLLRRTTPALLRRLPIPYYASQTTALARKV